MDERRAGYGNLDSRLRAVESGLKTLTETVERNERILVGADDGDDTAGGVRGKMTQVSTLVARMDLKFTIVLWLLIVLLALTAPSKLSDVLKMLTHL